MAEKDELFITADRRHQLVYSAYKLNAGYLIDFLRLSHVRVGAGVYGQCIGFRTICCSSTENARARMASSSASR